MLPICLKSPPSYSYMWKKEPDAKNAREVDRYRACSLQNTHFFWTMQPFSFSPSVIYELFFPPAFSNEFQLLLFRFAGQYPRNHVVSFKIRAESAHTLLFQKSTPDTLAGLLLTSFPHLALVSSLCSVS